jgi:ATP-dependent helicase/nuclease subunit A
VILDEAQDTDPTQFDVLLEIARPPSATGAWLETECGPPRPGHFCMVGDFQQSIFGERADLAHCRRVHDALLRTGAGEAVEFSVTFRLDRRQVDFVNATFVGVLNGDAGQVDFVQLNPRPDVLPGQVVRFELDVPDTTGWNEWRKAHHEAQAFARWLRAQGLAKLRAQSWRDVAVLCPRKGWFTVLRDALRKENFDVQLQSERDLKGDSPAYAWFTALAVIMAEPRHGYEIVGVLREVFGLSDHDLAAFAEGCGERFQIAEPTVRTGVVADALNLLAATRSRSIALPLFSALRQVTRATQLRDRLLALPADEFENLDAELDDLLTLAATAEAGGRTLADFAEELRAGFSAIREVRTTVRDAVQLITCHKAKGSEWPVVVVPFFARGVRQRSRGYPRLLRDPRTGVTHAALTSADIDEELKALIDAEARQELERLLYVALTRARHTLVLAHDHALFSGKSGLPKNAPARLLGCGEKQPNAPAFTALPTAPVACAATAAEQAEKTAHRALEQTVPALAPLAHEAANAARARATLFIKRNPSALAEAALAEADPAAYFEMTRRAAVGGGGGALYGTWWHEFIEHLDWRADAAAWEATFTAALSDSPDAALSRREWTLLREQLTSGSDLARLLTAPGVIVHAEMPFLWAMNERECLEGIIDLALFDPAAGSWLVVDWKTNRTSAADLPKLREHYLPQLSAYWKAMTEMLRAPVNAGLYSTATGAWLPYDNVALAEAWTKLSREPAAIMQALSER